MQQQRNLLLFFVLTFLVLFGWQLVQDWLGLTPRPKKPAARTTVAEDDWRDAPARIQAALGAVAGVQASLGTTLNTAVPQLAVEARLAHWASQERRLAVEKLRLAEKAARARARPRPAPTPPIKEEEINLGGEGFNLLVTLTNKGAAVRQLTLRNFEAADRFGLPTGQELRLLPREANRDIASNVVYHYRDPDDDQPLDTLGNLHWTVEKKHHAPGSEVHEVVFVADVPDSDVRLRKTYTLRPADYHLGLALTIERPAEAAADPVKFRYQLTSGHGLPIEGEWYTTTFRTALGCTVDARGYPYRDYQEARTISPTLAGEALRRTDKRLQYAGIVNQFFASVIVVDDEQDKKDFLDWARPTLVNLDEPRDQHRPWLDNIVQRAVSVPLELKPGASVTHKYLLYNGPVKVRLLGHLKGARAVPAELVERYLETLQLKTLTDYQSPTPFGSFFSAIGWTRLLIATTNLMHGLLGYLYLVVPNYGLCIILLTVLVRGLMFPLSRKQALHARKMQELAPELKKLQEKYKDDREALMKASWELQRKHGASPFGSCWTVLLQMPIFLGLYYALQESIQFRLASFLWMKNLAAPDMLLKWGENIPVISWQVLPPTGFLGVFFSMLYLGPFLNVLPIIAVALQILFMKLMTPPPTDEQQAMTQKTMKYMMVFFGLLFYKVPAGLCLYFIVSSLWGVAERQFLPKAKSAAGSPQPAPTAPPAPRSGKAAGARPKAPPAKPSRDGFFDKMKRAWEEVLEQARKK